MTKEEVLQHVQGVIDAPSAYAGLKDVAKDYLASVGKADEKAKAEKLIAALKECVESIDDVLALGGRAFDGVKDDGGGVGTLPGLHQRQVRARPSGSAAGMS